MLHERPWAIPVNPKRKYRTIFAKNTVSYELSAKEL